MRTPRKRAAPKTGSARKAKATPAASANGTDTDMNGTGDAEDDHNESPTKKTKITTPAANGRKRTPAKKKVVEALQEAQDAETQDEQDGASVKTEKGDDDEGGIVAAVLTVKAEDVDGGVGAATAAVEAD